MLIIFKNAAEVKRIMKGDQKEIYLLPTPSNTRDMKELLNEEYMSNEEFMEDLVNHDSLHRYFYHDVLLTDGEEVKAAKISVQYGTGVARWGAEPGSYYFKLRVREVFPEFVESENLKTGDVVPGFIVSDEDDLILLDPVTGENIFCNPKVRNASQAVLCKVLCGENAALIDDVD